MILRNYYSLLSYGMFAQAPVVVATNGESYTVSSAGMSIPSALATLMTGYGGVGVVMGTGDEPEALGDYKLSGSVITGFVYSKTTSSGKDENGPWAKAKYTITNNNSSARTIKEVGIMQSYGSSAYCMVERTVLAVPITIEGNGGVGQLEYTVRYNVPELPDTDPDWAGSYGVEWNYNSNSTKLTRIGDAADFASPVPASTVDAVGTSPFDDIMPWAGMKRYNIIDGVVSYSENDVGFSMTDNETVVYIPEFWFAVHKDPYSMKTRFAISPTAKQGFQKHPGSGRYIGRYHTANSSGYVTKTGLSPVANMTRATARANSHTKGDKWWQMDIAVWSALQLLYLVEFADWYSQNVLGDGNDSGSKRNTGRTDACVYHTLKRSGDSNQYRWVENPYSNLYTWMDGFVASGMSVYLNMDNSKNGDTTSNHTYSGITLPSSGFISRYGLSETFPWAFLPSVVGGGETSYVTDYLYSYTGVRVACVGGSYYANASYGFFCLYADSDASDADSNIGSRLQYIP